MTAVVAAVAVGGGGGVGVAAYFTPRCCNSLMGLLLIPLTLMTCMEVRPLEMPRVAV